MIFFTGLPKVKFVSSLNVSRNRVSNLISCRISCSSVQFLYQSDLVPMYFTMFCKITLIGKHLTAFVALEWSLTSVRPRVLLQITRLSGCIVALVTLERLLFCVLHHYVAFHINCSDA